MNPRNPLAKKIPYVVAIVVLLFPLFLLSQPSSKPGQGEGENPGGKLAKLRKENRLTHAELGTIDPTSETLKLASLGMRGIAVNILWHKANEYKKTKDWTNLKATVNQIINLQPHYIGVWRFQAWNLSYNVSAEFDDYRDRFHWVIRGIEFLQEGIRKNDRTPRLHWEVGWFVSQKIGRSDEKKEFRQLFKSDVCDDFHESLPHKMRDPSRDNWLIGKNWFRSVEDMVDRKVGNMGGLSALLFRSDAPMCQIHYADNLEKDGIFGELAEMAWIKAHEDWEKYGKFPLYSSLVEGNVYLAQQEEYEARVQDATAKLDALVGEDEFDTDLCERVRKQRVVDLAKEAREAWELDEADRTDEQKKLAAEIEPKLLRPVTLRDTIRQQRIESLPKKEREALEIDVSDRSSEQHLLVSNARGKINVTHRDVLGKLKGADRQEGRELAEQAEADEKMVTAIRRNRQIVNFKYWRQRVATEQTVEMRDARRQIYEADQLLRKGSVLKAVAGYEEGFKTWRIVFTNHPGLLDVKLECEELVEVINRYERALKQDNRQLPDDFVLQDVLDRYGKHQKEEEEKPKQRGTQQLDERPT